MKYIFLSRNSSGKTGRNRVRLLPILLVLAVLYAQNSFSDQALLPASENDGDRLIEFIPPPAAETPVSKPLPETRPEDKEQLVILGVRPITQIPADSLPNDAFLVQIPTAVKPGSVGEPSVFLCRINHLSDAEISLLADARDGEWDSVEFLDAVLIAEGVTQERRLASERIYNSLLAELRSETVQARSEREKVRIVFEFLHRRVLTGSYNLNRSSAAVSLETGVYNCVSASILFNALARSVGLISYGLETPGHAKSRIDFGDEYLDIETTCPDWDLLPDRPVKRETDVTVARPISSETADITPTGDSSETASPAAAKAKPRCREVTPVEFVATIYYNIGVDYYQAGRYGPAIAAYLKAATLDPNNRTVLGNLKATLNNLAIELATRKNFAEAIRLTEQGLLLDPEFDQFKTNLPLYYRHWIDDLRRNGHAEQAARLATNPRAKRGEPTPAAE